MTFTIHSALEKELSAKFTVFMLNVQKNPLLLWRTPKPNYRKILYYKKK